jgi:regulator of protease activity HflC (stomatin/prohibitin superfamily)
MDIIVEFMVAATVVFVAMWFVMPLTMWFIRLVGLYTVVEEGTCQVFILFGRVVGILTEPGLHILPISLGPSAFLVNWLGSRRVLDMRLDQQYLRSNPVNSEEGAPMGVGIWYEMYISEPVSYLFKNADPQGSLAANVSNAVVRSLSNMPLEQMLINRHSMSRTVREEVSPRSHEWGYKLGSIYIRKVHFRDAGMTHQIEAKVVNRLRQVTSAIKQDGANQVGIISSTADRQAAVEFARAAAIRPRIVGEVLQDISVEEEIATAIFEILETQKILEGRGQLLLIPPGNALLSQLLVAQKSK